MFKVTVRRTLVAFALVEVMVVSGIMSSMASSQGSFRFAIDKAREVEGTNNLRQIHMCLQAQCIGGELPKAAFYPKGDPRKDPQSIVTLMPDVPAKMWLSPFAPEEFKTKGLTFVWNDTVNGKTFDTVPKDTWLMIDMAAFITDPKMQKPHKYLVLYASGDAKAVSELPYDVKKFVEEAQAKGKGVPAK